MSEGKMSADELVQRLKNLRDYCIGADHGTGAFADDIRAVDQMLAAYATLQREADGMREALVKVAHAMDTLIHEGVDRGKGHWPAWDDCARAVDAARAALNGPPQEERS